MKGWDYAAIEFYETGKVEKRPFCGSNDVKVEVHIGSIRDSISFTCRACGRFDHYDGVSNDEFVLEYGLEPKLSHKPCLSGDPGAMLGAYCVIRFMNGSMQPWFMAKHEIDAHRARSSSSSNGPWVTDYDEMAKKTVFRSMFKWLPITIEQARAVGMDDSVSRLSSEGASAEDAQDMLEIEFVTNTEGE